MISICMISHGDFATGLLQTLGLFCGELEGIEALTLQEQDQPEEFGNRIKEVFHRLDTNEGMLILTDIPGGSPCNQAARFAQTQDKVRIVSGLNLLMVLDAYLKRSNKELDCLCDEIILSARESIQRIVIQPVDLMDDNAAEF